MNDRVTHRPNVTIYVDGSIVLFTPLTAASWKWFDENVQIESWQWLGESLAVEARFAAGLRAGLIEGGFELD